MAEAEANFASILDMPSEGGKRPPPLPAGSYLSVVQGLPKHDKSAKKGTPYVEFTLKLTSALEDVDTDALSEIGGIGERTVRTTYYLTEGSKWRLDKFLKDLGLDDANYESRRAMLDDTPNQQVGVAIKHTASQDGQSVYAEVADTFLVE